MLKIALLKFAFVDSKLHSFRAVLLVPIIADMFYDCNHYEFCFAAC